MLLIVLRGEYSTNTALKAKRVDTPAMKILNVIFIYLSIVLV